MDIEERKVDHPDFSCIYRRGYGVRPVVVFRRDEVGPAKNPAFTRQDMAIMLGAVRRALPDYRVVDWWNGEGCHTFSVSVQRRW